MNSPLQELFFESEHPAVVALEEAWLRYDQNKVDIPNWLTFVSGIKNEQLTLIALLASIDVECRLRFGLPITLSQYLTHIGPVTVFLQLVEKAVGPDADSNRINGPRADRLLHRIRHFPAFFDDPLSPNDGTTPGTAQVNIHTAPTEALGRAADNKEPAPDHSFPNVPNYRITRQLAQGGMGTVYHAMDLKLNREVALKLTNRLEKEDLARFQREAKTWASLNHRNIVTVFDSGEFDRRLFIAMEFCPKGDLVSRLPFEPDRAARLVELLAHAVHVMHQNGVIHRDLKPHNILISNNDEPKIADFGLAKWIGEAGITKTGDVLGTPSYMSPEQARGLNREVGCATDIYGLGGILYAGLTGQPPFPSDELTEVILWKVTSHDPSPPARLRPIPRDLNVICLKCLEKEPNKRYPTALALAEDLGRFREHKPIVARPASSVERLVKWAKRRPAVAALTSLFMSSLVAGTLVSLLFAIDARHQAEQTEEKNHELKLSLARSLLMPIRPRHLQLDFIADGPSLLHEEIAVLRQIEKNRQENAEIFDLMIQEAGTDDDLAQRLKFRGLYIMQAGVGLDHAIRSKTEDTLFRMLSADGIPASRKAILAPAVASLGDSSERTARIAAEHLRPVSDLWAAGVLVELTKRMDRREATDLLLQRITDDTLDESAVTLLALELVKLIKVAPNDVATLTSKKAMDSLLARWFQKRSFELSQAIATIATTLSSADALVASNTIEQRLQEHRKQVPMMQLPRAYHFDEGSLYGVLADRMEPRDASALLNRFATRYLEPANILKDVQPGQQFAPYHPEADVILLFQSLLIGNSGRLVPQLRATCVDRLIGEIERTPSRSEDYLQVLHQLCASLNNDESSAISGRVAEVLVHQLKTNAKVNKMSELVSRFGEYDARWKYLVTFGNHIAPRRRQEIYSEAKDAFLAILGMATPGDKILDPLDFEQFHKNNIRSTVLTHFAHFISATDHSDESAKRLSEFIVGLDEHPLPLMPVRSNEGLLFELSDALAKVDEARPTGETRRLCNAIAVRLGQFDKMVVPRECELRALALARVCGRIENDHREKACKPVAEKLAEIIIRGRFEKGWDFRSEEFRDLSKGLGSVASCLNAEHAQQICSPVTKKLLVMLERANGDSIDDADCLIAALGGLAPFLNGSQTEAAMQLLLESMGRAQSEYGFLQQEFVPQVRRRPANKDLTWRDTPGHFLNRAPAPSSIMLVRLLKKGLCVDSARRTVLDHLGRQCDSSFSTQWDFVRHANSLRLRLDP